MASLPSSGFLPPPPAPLLFTNLATAPMSPYSFYVQISHSCLHSAIFQEVVLKIPVPRKQSTLFPDASECILITSSPFSSIIMSAKSGYSVLLWEQNNPKVQRVNSVGNLLLAHVTCSLGLGGVSVPHIFSKTQTDGGSDILKLPSPGGRGRADMLARRERG